MLRKALAAALLVFVCAPAGAGPLPGMDTVKEYVKALLARTPMEMGAFELRDVFLLDDRVELQIHITDKPAAELNDDYWKAVDVMALETTFCANEAQQMAYQEGLGLRFVYFGNDNAKKEVFQRDVPASACRGSAAPEPRVESDDPEQRLNSLIVRLRQLQPQAIDEKGEIVNDGAWLNDKEVAFQLKFAKKAAGGVGKAWFDGDLARVITVMHCKGTEEVEYALASGRTMLLHYVDKSGKPIKDVRVTKKQCDEIDERGLKK